MERPRRRSGHWLQVNPPSPLLPLTHSKVPGGPHRLQLPGPSPRPTLLGRKWTLRAQVTCTQLVETALGFKPRFKGCRIQVESQSQNHRQDRHRLGPFHPSKPQPSAAYQWLQGLRAVGSGDQGPLHSPCPGTERAAPPCWSLALAPHIPQWLDQALGPVPSQLGREYKYSVCTSRQPPLFSLLQLGPSGPTKHLLSVPLGASHSSALVPGRAPEHTPSASGPRRPT